MMCRYPAESSPMYIRRMRVIYNAYQNLLAETELNGEYNLREYTHVEYGPVKYLS